VKSNKQIFKLLPAKNKTDSNRHKQPVSALVVAPIQVSSQLRELVSVLAAADCEASRHRMTLTEVYCEHEGIPEYAGRVAVSSPV